MPAVESAAATKSTAMIVAVEKFVELLASYRRRG